MEIITPGCQSEGPTRQGPNQVLIRGLGCRSRKCDAQSPSPGYRSRVATTNHSHHGRSGAGSRADTWDTSDRSYERDRDYSPEKRGHDQRHGRCAPYLPHTVSVSLVDIARGHPAVHTVNTVNMGRPPGGRDGLRTGDQGSAESIHKACRKRIAGYRGREMSVGGVQQSDGWGTASALVPRRWSACIAA